MSDISSQQRATVPTYIHVYLWVALVVLSVVPFFAAFIATIDATAGQTITAAILAVVLFQAVFWFARVRCTSPDLSYWDGLLLVTAYMTIGVGGVSLIMSGFCAMVTAIASIGIALVGLFKSDPQFSSRHFRGLVMFFGRQRMYQ